jgi:hypothetical protein
MSKVTGVAGVILEMKRLGERTSRAALVQLRKEAKLIAEISQEQAPVLEGNLEMSHQVIETIGGARRVEIAIEVGGEVNGVDVNAYIDFIHEAVYQLGPKSLEKQGHVTRLVGRKFLERARDERQDKIAGAIETAIQKVL